MLGRTSRASIIHRRYTPREEWADREGERAVEGQGDCWGGVGRPHDVSTLGFPHHAQGVCWVCVGVWVCWCVGVGMWVCGCVCVFVCGCVEVWVCVVLVCGVVVATAASGV